MSIEARSTEPCRPSGVRRPSPGPRAANDPRAAPESFSVVDRRAWRGPDARDRRLSKDLA